VQKTLAPKYGLLDNVFLNQLDNGRLDTSPWARLFLDTFVIGFVPLPANAVTLFSPILIRYETDISRVLR
jgi:hypothetical protein